MTKHFKIRALAAVVLAAVCSVAAADVVVIVNPKNPTASMTSEQVGAMFLGKSTGFPGGGSATMVDQPEGSPIYEQFYTKATGKNGAQVKATWARLTFSGKAVPPKGLAGTADVKKFVAANADAIGYIEKSAVDASVKVVLQVD